jgi:23S rRNA (adenine2503-C2)-methyltransferase
VNPTWIGRELADLETALAGQPKFRARQVFDALYKARVGSMSEVTTLPAALRTELEVTPFGLPTEQTAFTSTDGTVRYLLSLQDGRTVETVFMPDETRDSICISTQVGCPVNCQFCLTAQMGLERNLTAGEIVGQVLYVARRHALDPAARQLNLVMMGQGEPLLNLENVLKATRILCDQRGIGMSEKRITVSTSGIIPRIVEFGQAEVRPKLAISLNASNEEQRIAIMPITKKYRLADLLDACRDYPLRSGERITFEYVLLGGVNDSEADARRVVGLLGNLRAKVNLIALNPGPGIPYEMPAAERVNRFHEIVARALPVFVRKPRGRDIYAACGQLKRMTEGELVTIA